MKRFAATALCALALAAPAAAERIRLDAESRHTVVIVEFEPSSGAQPEYVQLITGAAESRENATTGDRLNGRMSASLDYRPGQNPGVTFAAERTVAGNFGFGSLFAGNVPMLNWNICYPEQIRFEANAGEAVFIGRLSADAVRADFAPYERLARPRPGAIVYTSIQTDGRPPLTPPEELPGWEERVGAYMREHHPRMTAPVRAAQLQYRAGRCVSETTNGHTWIHWEPLEQQ